MRELEELRGLLILLDGLIADRCKLSKIKATAAKLKAAQLSARGWKFLACMNGDNPKQLLELVANEATDLIQYRPGCVGRPEKALAKHYQERDGLIIADMGRGMKLDAAICVHYPHAFDSNRQRISKRIFDAHRRRITRRIEEEKETIALQTPERETDINYR